MKMIVKLIVMSALLMGSLTVAMNAGTSSASIDGRIVSNDNKDKKRGRRRDDGNSNSSNANSNSNSGSSNNSGRTSGEIGLEQARSIALQAIPGLVLKEEIEREHGRSNFEFYIRKAGGDVYEVYVDAATGKVVKVERKDD